VHLAPRPLARRALRARRLRGVRARRLRARPTGGRRTLPRPTGARPTGARPSPVPTARIRTARIRRPRRPTRPSRIPVRRRRTSFPRPAGAPTRLCAAAAIRKCSEPSRAGAGRRLPGFEASARACVERTHDDLADLVAPPRPQKPEPATGSDAVSPSRRARPRGRSGRGSGRPAFSLPLVGRPSVRRPAKWVAIRKARSCFLRGTGRRRGRGPLQEHERPAHRSLTVPHHDVAPVSRIPCPNRQIGQFPEIALRVQRIRRTNDRPGALGAALPFHLHDPWSLRPHIRR